jgi:hypothetical protein
MSRSLLTYKNPWADIPVFPGGEAVAYVSGEILRHFVGMTPDVLLESGKNVADSGRVENEKRTATDGEGTQ